MNGMPRDEDIQVLSSAEVLTCLGPYKNAISFQFNEAFNSDFQTIVIDSNLSGYAYYCFDQNLLLSVLQKAEMHLKATN